MVDGKIMHIVQIQASPGARRSTAKISNHSDSFFKYYFQESMKSVFLLQFISNRTPWEWIPVFISHYPVQFAR